VELVAGGLPSETDINLVTATLKQAMVAVGAYADPGWAPTGWSRLCDTAREAMVAAEPGSGHQLAWARAYLETARCQADLDAITRWLSGNGVPDGLAIDTEMRWALVRALVAQGRMGEPEISAELDRDRTASGERLAAEATALIATPEAKD